MRLPQKQNIQEVVLPENLRLPRVTCEMVFHRLGYMKSPEINRKPGVEMCDLHDSHDMADEVALKPRAMDQFRIDPQAQFVLKGLLSYLHHRGLSSTEIDWIHDLGSHACVLRYHQKFFRALGMDDPFARFKPEEIEKIISQNQCRVTIESNSTVNNSEGPFDVLKLTKNTAAAVLGCIALLRR